MTGVARVLALAGVTSVLTFGFVALEISDTTMNAAANGNVAVVSQGIVVMMFLIIAFSVAQAASP